MKCVSSVKPWIEAGSPPGSPDTLPAPAPMARAAVGFRRGKLGAAPQRAGCEHPGRARGPRRVAVAELLTAEGRRTPRMVYEGWCGAGIFAWRGDSTWPCAARRSRSESRPRRGSPFLLVLLEHGAGEHLVLGRLLGAELVRVRWEALLGAGQRRGHRLSCRLARCHDCLAKTQPVSVDPFFIHSRTPHPAPRHTETTECHRAARPTPW